MSFPRTVNYQQAPGVAGTFASTNPVQSVVAGEAALVAGNSALAGYFHWIQTDNTIESNGPVPLTVPDGFLANVHQGLITTWLANATLQVPKGLAVTLYDRGDFWVSNLFAAAVSGDKVFVNAYGTVIAAAAGSFVTTDIGSGGSITSGHIDDGTTDGTVGNVLTVVSVAAGSPVLVGTAITDANGNVVGTVAALGSGTGGAGTYYLNQNASYPAASTFTVTGYAATGWVGTASFATDVMTVVSTTSGTPAVGQVISSASVDAGTYITVDNGDGTYNLSTSPGTIATQAASASGWIETPFSFKSNANPGDVAIIGIKN